MNKSVGIPAKNSSNLLTGIMVLDKIKKCPIFIFKINIAYVLLMYIMKQSCFILNKFICDRTCCYFHGCISFYKYVSTIAPEIVAKNFQLDSIK